MMLPKSQSEWQQNLTIRCIIKLDIALVRPNNGFWSARRAMGAQIHPWAISCNPVNGCRISTVSRDTCYICNIPHNNYVICVNYFKERGYVLFSKMLKGEFIQHKSYEMCIGHDNDHVGELYSPSAISWRLLFKIGILYHQGVLHSTWVFWSCHLEVFEISQYVGVRF